MQSTQTSGSNRRTRIRRGIRRCIQNSCATRAANFPLGSKSKINIPLTRITGDMKPKVTTPWMTLFPGEVTTMDYLDFEGKPTIDKRFGPEGKRCLFRLSHGED